MARPHALVVAAVLGAPCLARAETLALPETRATIALDTSEWHPAERASGLVVGYQTTTGRFLAITRAGVPNPDAWRDKTREAYVDRIERGLAASIAGYERTARTIRDVNGVPAVDLEVRSARPTMIVIRVLLFRTYALCLALEVEKAALPHARAIVQTFAPPR